MNEHAHQDTPAGARKTRWYVASTPIAGGCFAMMVPIAVVVSTILAAVFLAKQLHAVALVIPVLGIAAALGFVLSPALLVVEDQGVRIRWMGKARWFPRKQIEGVDVFDFIGESADDWNRPQAAYRRPTRWVGIAIRCGDVVRVPMITGTDASRARAETLAATIRAMLER